MWMLKSKGTEKRELGQKTVLLIDVENPKEVSLKR